MIPVNRKVGRFEIVRKLARGGMADVYLGRDEESGAAVALKVIEHGSDADTLESIQAERHGSALQARLSAVDARVVQVVETGDTDGCFYVAMEYVEGQDLSELIRQGPVPAAKAVDIGIAVCETLEHAHSLQTTIDGRAYRGIVHGDVKPRNIRIDKRGRVRVLDFGIAKALGLSRRLTRNEFASIQYAAPERLETGHVDALCDLWSVGVVLYEMVTGLLPYQGQSTERLDKMIRSGVPAPPPPNTCPEPLRTIIVKAMTPEPSRRYQSAAELGADLRAFRDRGVSPVANGVPDEATRRSARPAATDDDRTRRTVSPLPPNSHKTAVAPKNAKLKRGIGRLVLRGVGLAFLAILLYSGYVATSTYLLWQRGQHFEQQIKTESLTDPDAIWQKWTELSSGHPSSFVLREPRRAVKLNLVGASDKVILTYRNVESQVVTQKEWERARSYLAKALTLDPGDNGVRGRLRLCEGHIARITGTVRRAIPQLNQAVEKFREAEQLLPNTVDPLLGLARLYVYGFKDIGKAYNALQEAEHRGYQLGNREKAQLADGYRDRADRRWKDSRAIRGLPQEKEQVHRVVEDYKFALKLYQEIAPFGNATANISRVQGALEVVEKREDELQGWFKKLWP